MNPYIEIGNKLFKIIVPSYALFGSIGMFSMMLLIYKRNERIGISFEKLLFLFVALFCGAAAGSKLLFFITRINHILNDFSIKHLLYELVTGGFVFYGGLFGAIVGAIFFSKIFKYKKEQIINLIAPAFPVFHFWGRIGCFFAGCCYGKESSFGVALESEPAILRLPIQLIEASMIIIIAILVLYCEKRFRKVNLMKLYLFLYSICRFITEFFRGDEIRGMFCGFSTSQWISLALLIWLMINWKKKREKIVISFM